jgi:hypothetical protein
MATITWTGRNDEKIKESGVPILASYNPDVLATEHQRRRALINLAEQSFRTKHKEYGKFGLLFGHCEVVLEDNTYYEFG